jgi:hypothetical protein
LLIGLNGCIELPTEVPDDFQLEYGWGACFTQWGRYTLTLYSNGSATYEYLKGMTKEYEYYNFTNEELLEIYSEVIRHKFFDLKEQYSNPNILDGSCSYLQIKADEKEHRVSVSNEHITPFDRITQKIIEILNLKNDTLIERNIPVDNQNFFKTGLHRL